MNEDKNNPPVPPHLFKFTELCWAKEMCSIGLYLIGTLYEYRSKEPASGVRDEHEGELEVVEHIGDGVLTEKTHSENTKGLLGVQRAQEFT